MTEVFLSLGSNMGDRMDHLLSAVKMLRAEEHIYDVESSPVFETAPVGYLDQDPFLNICVRLHTDLTPTALLNVCQKIENTLLRKRVIHWGPRTIDLDILTYGKRKVNTKRLQIPHPRMQERGFVQVPLAFLHGQREIPDKWKEDVRYFCEMPNIDS